MADYCSPDFCWTTGQDVGAARPLADAIARSPACAASGGPTNRAHTVKATMATAESTGTTTVLFNIAIPGVGVKLDGESRGGVSDGQMSVS